MNNCKIIIFTINDIYYDQRMIKIATALQNAGYHVVWIGRARQSEILNQKIDFTTKRWNFIFNRGPLLYLEYALRQFLFLMIHRSYRNVYCCDVDTLVGVWACSRLRKLNVIYDAHEYFTETPELEGQKWKKKVWQWIENKGVDIAEKRITVAHHLAKKLEMLYGKNFEVIRNLPVVGKSQNFNSKENIIIYQGVLNRGRGLEIAIEAMDLLPEYQLLICGDGDISESLEQMAIGKANIQFFGLLEPNALKELTSKAKYGLNLLDLKSENYNLSLANKFFDYAAMGVVSINSPGVEYVDYQAKYNHCLILDNLYPVDLANLIKKTSDIAFLEMQIKSLKMVNANNWLLESQKLIKYLPLSDFCKK